MLFMEGTTIGVVLGLFLFTGIIAFFVYMLYKHNYIKSKITLAVIGVIMIQVLISPSPRAMLVDTIVIVALIIGIGLILRYTKKNKYNFETSHKIKELQHLKNEGFIDEEEFNESKKKILNNL